jgi:GNAT superfamily N-acetyltransferase
MWNLRKRRKPFSGPKDSRSGCLRRIRRFYRILKQRPTGVLFTRFVKGKDAIAFFDFSFEPGEWWSGRTAMAGYISGIVVARESRGSGVGSVILGWAEARVRDRGARNLRLDCHAGNGWLCEYCQSNGFAEVARVKQHPGYVGVLYQKQLGALPGDGWRSLW